MINTLPISRPALAGETGFSLLARNTFSNASDTTAEFCGAVGLIKSALCAGAKDELIKLAKLTGSDTTSILSHSPFYESRKFAYLNGQRFLSRSIRKQDLSICPACWGNDLSIAKHHLYVRSFWLPKSIGTCTEHKLALIPIPYGDYTSCYDHFLRIDMETQWLSRLPQLEVPQRLSNFEKAALQQLQDGSPICSWLPDVQIDVMETWCLGIGLFISRGKARPEHLNSSEKRRLTDLGLKATLGGVHNLEKEIDAALTRHRVRLSGTWVQKWASQSSKPPERQAIRLLMRDICSKQGHFNLTSIATASWAEYFMNAKIADIAENTRRSKAWVRHALQREGLIPKSGVPEVRDLKQQMRRCRTFINAAVTSLDSTKSASKLNIGIKGFESLVEDNVVQSMRNRSHKKRRFRPQDIENILEVLDRNVGDHSCADEDDYCSIPDACFQMGATTAQITRLIFGGQLPNTIRTKGSRGFKGVRIHRGELRGAMKILTDDHIGSNELAKVLGLTFSDLRVLRETYLLPHFPAPKGQGYRPEKAISKIVLQRFLERFQTIKTAAKHLGTSEKELHAKISLASILPAKEGKGVPIYYRADIFRI